jgi:hypothetical protein
MSSTAARKPGATGIRVKQAQNARARRFESSCRAGRKTAMCERLRRKYFEGCALA